MACKYLLVKFCGLLLVLITGELIGSNAYAADFAFRERFSSIFDERGQFYQKSSETKNRRGLAFGSFIDPKQGELTMVAGLSSFYSLALTANYNKVLKAAQNNGQLAGSFSTQKKSAGFDTDLRFHPLENGFFAALGFRLGQNSSMTSTSLTGNQTIKLAGFSYGRQSLTHIQMVRSYKNIAPRFTIGFDNSLIQRKRFGFHLTAGFVYQGQGKTTFDVAYANNLNPLTNASLPQHLSEASKGAFTDKSHKALLPIASAGFKINF